MVDARRKATAEAVQKLTAIAKTRPLTRGELDKLFKAWASLGLEDVPQPTTFTHDQMEKLGNLAVTARAVVMANATKDLKPRHIKALEKALTAVEDMAEGFPVL